MSKGKRRGVKKRARAQGCRQLLPGLLVALLLAGGLAGWLVQGAAIVRICPAEVYIPDLPSQFDGTTILYVSDADIRNSADANASEKLLRKLRDLQPDILMLGGDYSAGTVLDVLNGTSNAGKVEDAAHFIRSLTDFYAPLGKFAVLGEEDSIGAELTEAFLAAGVQLLQDSYVTVSRDGAQLKVAGLRDVSENRTSYDEMGRNFQAGECVIVLAHNPLAYTRIRMSEAGNGGAWADMVLSGHTLGGQIKLFGRTLRSFSEEESRRIAGWYYGDDLPILVSQGLGSRGAKLRLGTRSEVWLITLRRPAWQAAP